MGCHGWQVKLIESSRVKEIEGNSPRSCCQGDRKILIYMKKTYKTIKTINARLTLLMILNPPKIIK
jgi:hypothetical protein